MSSGIASLVKAPTVNPINGKALTIPFLNPIDKYGRVFFFSWLGFMVAFLSWYAFPPLLTTTIKADLKMSQADVANSNIVALLATLLLRLICGPLCDRFGPRRVFAWVLICGSIPTVLAGAVTTPRGLIALRFFVGILGASFVPCQVWCTGFFDKPVIGTANALAAGLGNAGGGITYFMMPAVYDSLVHKRHLTPHVAWRVSYIVPFIIINCLALCLLFLCQDTPTGKWSERHITVVVLQETRDPGQAFVEPFARHPYSEAHKASDDDLPKEEEMKVDTEVQIQEPDLVEIAQGEVIVTPTLKEISSVMLSIHSLALAIAYGASFGSELAINSILGAYYYANFHRLGQTESGNWAAMFGLLNVVLRPAGGFIADRLYHATASIWPKKLLVHFLGIIMGVFEIAIGLTNPHKQSTMFGLFAGLAFFLEAGNGANFAVVPHVHPYANGIVSGLVGAAGNLGGIIFAIIFRYNGADYGRALWIIGIISIVMNVAVSWIAPISKGQIGGR